MNDEAARSTQSASPSRILVADDHPLFRGALEQVVGGQPDLEVVGEAVDGKEALELCRRLQPDLVLMDMSMPRMDGIEATRTIKGECPRTIVLMLTASMDLDHLAEAIKAGAAGYILKSAHLPHIVDAIRGALSGESSLNQGMAMELLKRVFNEAPRCEEGPAVDTSQRGSDNQRWHPLLEKLSQREVEVLGLLARGRTNQEIARNLLVSVSTVKKHVQHVIAKLRVSDRTQAAVRAIELGLRPEEQHRADEGTPR